MSVLGIIGLAEKINNQPHLNLDTFWGRHKVAILIGIGSVAAISCVALAVLAWPASCGFIGAFVAAHLSSLAAWPIAYKVAIVAGSGVLAVGAGCGAWGIAKKDVTEIDKMHKLMQLTLGNLPVICGSLDELYKKNDLRKDKTVKQTAQQEAQALITQIASESLGFSEKITVNGKHFNLIDLIKLLNIPVVRDLKSSVFSSNSEKDRSYATDQVKGCVASEWGNKTCEEKTKILQILSCFLAGALESIDLQYEVNRMGNCSDEDAPMDQDGNQKYMYTCLQKKLPSAGWMIDADRNGMVIQGFVESDFTIYENVSNLMDDEKQPIGTVSVRTDINSAGCNVQQVKHSYGRFRASSSDIF